MNAHNIIGNATRKLSSSTTHRGNDFYSKVGAPESSLTTKSLVPSDRRRAPPSSYKHEVGMSSHDSRSTSKRDFGGTSKHGYGGTSRHNSGDTERYKGSSTSKAAKEAPTLSKSRSSHRDSDEEALVPYRSRKANDSLGSIMSYDSVNNHLSRDVPQNRQGPSSSTQIAKQSTKELKSTKKDDKSFLKSAISSFKAPPSSFKDEDKPSVQGSQTTVKAGSTRRASVAAPSRRESATQKDKLAFLNDEKSIFKNAVATYGPSTGSSAKPSSSKEVAHRDHHGSSSSRHASNHHTNVMMKNDQKHLHVSNKEGDKHVHLPLHIHRGSHSSHHQNTDKIASASEQALAVSRPKSQDTAEIDALKKQLAALEVSAVTEKARAKLAQQKQQFEQNNAMLEMQRQFLQTNAVSAMANQAQFTEMQKQNTQMSAAHAQDQRENMKTAGLLYREMTKGLELANQQNAKNQVALGRAEGKAEVEKQMARGAMKSKMEAASDKGKGKDKDKLPIHLNVVNHHQNVVHNPQTTNHHMQSEQRSEQHRRRGGIGVIAPVYGPWCHCCRH